MRASDIQQTGKGCSASLLSLVKGHSTPLQSTMKNLCRSTAAQTRVSIKTYLHKWKDKPPSTINSCSKFWERCIGIITSTRSQICGDANPIICWRCIDWLVEMPNGDWQSKIKEDGEWAHCISLNNSEGAKHVLLNKSNQVWWVFYHIQVVCCIRPGQLYLILRRQVFCHAQVGCCVRHKWRFERINKWEPCTFWAASCRSISCSNLL